MPRVDGCRCTLSQNVMPTSGPRSYSYQYNAPGGSVKVNTIADAADRHSAACSGARRLLASPGFPRCPSPHLEDFSLPRVQGRLYLLEGGEWSRGAFDRIGPSDNSTDVHDFQA